ncbi:MAG: hypothetical protein OXE17_08260 [Chloroflexi bacterium]|nr:hypothetical protein [Chloroflexota bacterium]
MNKPNISLTAMKQDADRLNAEIEHKKKQHDALLTVIDMYSGSGDAEPIAGNALADDAQAQSPEQRRESPKSMPHQTTDLSDLSVNFTGTSNMLERLCRIGRAAEGRLLNLTEVSKFLLKSGESDATLRNLRNNVYSCLKGHPEHFEKVGTGNYRYHDTPRTAGLDYRDYDSPAELFPPAHVLR